MLQGIAKPTCQRKRHTRMPACKHRPCLQVWCKPAALTTAVQEPTLSPCMARRATHNTATQKHTLLQEMYKVRPPVWHMLWLHALLSTQLQARWPSPELTPAHSSRHPARPHCQPAAALATASCSTIACYCKLTATSCQVMPTPAARNGCRCRQLIFVGGHTSKDTINKAHSAPVCCPAVHERPHCCAGTSASCSWNWSEHLMAAHNSAAALLKLPRW